MAQSTAGTVLGSVQDPMGTFVPNAVVELTNTGTNSVRSALSDGTGAFQFANVEPGTYVVTVAAPGFQKLQFTSFDLASRETRRLGAEVKVASQSTTVNVESAGNSSIQTDTSSIAETKTGRELVDLPVAIGTRGLGSTSPMSTLTTQPGVQTDAAGGISVAGTQPTMLAMTIDGISSVGPRTNGPLNELFPSFNAIQEIRVGETINPAEFGGVADITTISKSGSNAFHGGLFENLQNSYMNAGNTFSHTTPPLKMNDYGFFVGGPVLMPKLYNGHDKTFFFLSYEGLQLPRQVVQVQSVPSLAMRNGNLSALGGNLTGYPGNIIPAGQISPLAQKALQYLYPVPNYGAPGATSNNYLASFSVPTKSNQADLRLDQQLTPKQQVYARFTYKNRRVTTAPTGSALTGPVSQPEIADALTVAYNYVMSPSLVNELRTGFSGNHSTTSYGISSQAISDQLGLTSYLPGALPAGNAVPNFQITGYQSTGGQASSQSKNGTFQILETATWTKGQHTMKFGADYRYLTGLYTNVFATSRLGRYTFNGSVLKSLLGNSAATPFASFLLGYPDSTRIATVLQPDSKSYASHYGFFAQDDWKVTPYLTLNFGLRYEYHPMFRDHYDNLANFLPSYTGSTASGVNGAVVIPNEGVYKIVNPGFTQSIAPTPIITAAQAGIPESLRYSQKTDFAPRVGFAWRPFHDEKTVVRGGYGRFIQTLLGSAVLNAWAVESSNVANFKNAVVSGRPTYAFPNPYPSNIAQPGSQTFDLATDLHYKDPYVQQWNATVERDLGKSVSLRVSYDGSHGSNLGILTNLNQVKANTAGFATANLASPFPVFNYISYQTNLGYSNYNAMTVAVQKRFSRGLQFQTSYILARNLSNVGGYNPSATGFAGESGGTISDPYNPGVDYGNVNFTRRHRFLTTFLYELPFGKGKAFLNNNALMTRLVGGWQLGGVLLFQTGPYMSVLAAGDPSGTGFDQLVGNGRADTVTGVNPYAGQSLSSWINPAAYQAPPNNVGRFGYSSVGSVAGPGTEAVSLSLIKSVYITEAAHFQIGMEVANAFNHPNYATPTNLTLGTSGFASITNLQSAEGTGPRSVQLTARFNF